jgi:hypothetical protein
MYLEGFQTNITPSTNGFTVTYSQGECKGTVTYVKYVSELGRVMKGKPVYLMTNSDMGDIIECVHQKSPLSSEDFNTMNMEIRTHSRELIDSFLKIDR